MNRQDLDKYIEETYGIKADFPFEDDFKTAVYRHRESRKWFALLMQLPKEKFIPSTKEIVWVVNLKCDPLLIGSLLLEEGIHPAYHMNKSHWISVLINEIEKEKLCWLLDLSFELTSKQKN